MNIIAVVVTYNRMELLKRNIRCLQQNKPISSIVIVNNGSTVQRNGLPHRKG